MVRPKSDDPRSKTISVKFSGEEGDLFDRLVEQMKAEAEEAGGIATASSVLRSLAMREVRARGLDKPAKVGRKGTKK